MSTHNIGFYEDLTKINFELSSNSIKYTPYFFYCNITVILTVQLKGVYSSLFSLNQMWGIIRIAMF